MSAECLERLWGGYCFDLDGTLVDTAPDLHAALNHALHTHGHAPVGEDLARRFIGHGALVMIERAIEHNGDRCDNPEALLDTFLAYYDAHICIHSAPYPTVEETLQELRRRGARLAVVTNKRKHFADRLMGALGWSELFHTVIGGDTAARPKPAADPVLLAAEQLAVPMDDLLFIGDSRTDVGAARAAEVPVVCLRDGYNEGIPAEELGADAVIERFVELVPR